MSAACGAACKALARQLTVFAEGIPPLPVDGSKCVLVWIGNNAGLVARIDNGQVTVRDFEGSANAATNVDTTVRFDGLETLQAALRDQSAAPLLLLRRKIKVHGDFSWLEALRSANGARGSSPEALRAIGRELSAIVAAAANETSGVRDPLSASLQSSAMWVPDEASQSCMRCEVRFTALRRRHHCRRCGKLLCNSCAPRLGRNVPGGLKRVCVDCLEGRPSDVVQACSTVGSGAFASSTFAPAGSEEFGLAYEYACLKEELQALRVDYASREAIQLRHDVAAIWQATQFFIASAVAVLVLCHAIKLFSLYVMLLLFLRCFPNSIPRRYLHVFWTAFIVFLKVRWMRARIRTNSLDDKLADAERSMTYSIIGRFLYEQAISLGGYWPKVGQALSINALIPIEVRKELRQLQDQIPASPVSDVLKTIQQEFGADAASRLTVDPNAAPLGVASVAQVHQATLRERSGAEPRKVVVKVQHRGVERRFRQDIWSAGVIARIVPFLDPDGPDLRPVISKMLEVTLRELDFRIEASNQIRAAKTVQDADVHVIIPTVISELVSRRAMVMTFVDGVPLMKVKEELPWVDREQLVHSLVDHFAVQFTVDAHFHADPHPGNLMVERTTGRLCVLDWGMCITLPPERARTYAKLFYSAATSDLWAIVDALEGMGLKFKATKDDYFEPKLLLSWQRLMLRDSRPGKTAGDELGQMIETSKGLKEKGPERFQKFRFEDLPADMIYYLRAVNLTFFVSGELGVQHPILKTLFYRAHAQLLGQRSSASVSMLGNPRALLPHAAPQTFPAPRGSLERNLVALLRDAYGRGELLGAQLCVLKLPREGRRTPQVLAETAVGVRSWLDPAAVTSSTLFSLLDIAKLPVALAVLRLVDEGRLKLSDRLSAKWSEFAASGDREKDRITVEHLLSHTAGMWDPLPAGTKTVTDLMDYEARLADFARAPGVEAPGSTQRYHYASFGYLCAGLCRSHANRELPDLWRELAEESANLWGIHSASDLLLRLPPGHQDAARIHRDVSSAGLDEISTLLSSWQSLTDASAANSPVEAAAQRANGREHLIDLSMFSRDDLSAAMLPGLQAFGTARAVAGVLASVASGSLLSPGLVGEIQRSRRVSAESEADDELADQFRSMLRLEEFKEWGLGVQLVQRPGAGLCWGHLSQSGSMALALPGPDPKVVVLLLNRVDAADTNHQLAKAVLDVVSNHPAEER